MKRTTKTKKQLPNDSQAAAFYAYFASNSDTLYNLNTIFEGNIGRFPHQKSQRRKSAELLQIVPSFILGHFFKTNYRQCHFKAISQQLAIFFTHKTVKICKGQKFFTNTQIGF